MAQQDLTRDYDRTEVFGVELDTDTVERLKTVGFHAVLWPTIFVVLLPVFWMVVVSLNQVAFDTFLADPGEWWQGVSLDAYDRVMTETDFPVWFRNSALVTVAATGLSILVCTFGAYSIGDVGLFNTLTGLTIAYVAFVLPFSIWMLRGFYENLPESLEEAAMVDGSTRVGAILRVIVPISKPAIATTAIFAWIFAWNELLMAVILISDSAKTTLPPGLSTWVGRYTLQWDLMMAGALGATLPLFFILFFLQKYIINGLAEGAVKT